MRPAVSGRRAAGQSAVGLKPCEVFARLHLRAIDEGHDNVVHAGFHLNGNLRETIHDLRASGSRRAIDQREIRGSTDGLAKHGSAIDHDDHRVLALQRIAVRAHRQVRQGDLILAVGREAVFELHAAPRTQRWRVVWILVGVDRVFHAGHARIGIAHRDLSDVPRRGHVLIEERGRYAQGVRDVVEAFHLDVLRQNVLRVHVHAHQGLHRRGVLGAVQALDRHIASLRTLGVGVERVLHPRDERLDILLRRLRTARRRHLIPAQLAQRLLPDLSVVRRGLKVQSFQRKTTHLCAGAVAGDAVRLSPSPDVDSRRSARRRWSPETPETRAEPEARSRK